MRYFNDLYDFDDSTDFDNLDDGGHFDYQWNGMRFESRGDEEVAFIGGGPLLERSVFIIPEIIAGKRVVEIGEKAFRDGFWNAKRIELPKSVRKIGRLAFSRCSRLQRIVLHEGVEALPEGVFNDCSALQSVVVPSSVKSIAFDAFANCSSLYSIFVSKRNPRYVSEDGVLYDKERKSLVKFPQGRRGQNFVIPDGVEIIEDFALEEATDSSVTFPASVRFIGEKAFGWAELAELRVDENNRYFTSVDGVLFDKEMKTLVKYPARKTDARYVIPLGVEKIGVRAFSDCYKLKTVVLPRGLKILGESAFDGCCKLQTINVPYGVEFLPKRIFLHCSELLKIRIPSSVKSIGASAFRGCDRIKSVKIPHGVETIPNSAFNGCWRLKRVRIPSSVKSIGNCAFSDCRSLRRVRLTKKVEIIDRGAFSDCESVHRVHIPSSVSMIGEYAFSGCESLHSICVAKKNRRYASQDGVLFDKEMKTLLCYPRGKKTKRYVVPNRVITIMDGAFRGNPNLEKIELAPNIVTLGCNAFEFCVSLKSVLFPTGLKQIGASAFGCCQSLQTSTFPRNLN